MKKRFIIANAIMLAIMLAYVVYDVCINLRSPLGIALTVLAVNGFCASRSCLGKYRFSFYGT